MKTIRAERWHRRLRLLAIMLLFACVTVGLLTCRMGVKLPRVQRLLLHMRAPVAIDPWIPDSEQSRMSLEFPWDFRVSNNARYVTAGELVKPGKMNLLIIDQMNTGLIYDENMNDVSKPLTFPTAINSHPYSVMWQFNPVVARREGRDYLLRYAGGTVELIDFLAGDKVWETAIPAFANGLRGQFKVTEGPDGAETVLAYSRDAGVVAFIGAKDGSLLREVEVVADTVILPAQFDDDDFMEVLFVATGGDFHLYEHDGTSIRQGRFEGVNGYPMAVMPVKLQSGERGVRIGLSPAIHYSMDGSRDGIGDNTRLVGHPSVPLMIVPLPDDSVLVSTQQLILWYDPNGKEIDRISSPQQAFLILSCDWEKGEAVTAVMDPYNSVGTVGLLKLRK